MKYCEQLLHTCSMDALKFPKVSFYGKLCVFKIFCKLGDYTTLSAGDVIFSIHTFCKLYIQYHLCGTTLCEDVAVENVEVGRTCYLYFCHLLTRLWKKFGVLVFIFKVLGLVPHEFGNRASVVLLQERELPLKERLKILSAEQRSCSGTCLCLEERRNEGQHDFRILCRIQILSKLFF